MESLNRLMTACVVVRIEDFTLYRVTTSGRKQMPKEFVSCEYSVMWSGLLVHINYLILDIIIV